MIRRSALALPLWTPACGGDYCGDPEPAPTTPTGDTVDLAAALLACNEHSTEVSLTCLEAMGVDGTFSATSSSS